jgi:hypothetical protein
MSDFYLHCIKRRLDALTEQINKAWSDEARRASAEARRHKSAADEHSKTVKASPSMRTAQKQLHMGAADDHREAARLYNRAIKTQDKGVMAQAKDQGRMADAQTKGAFNYGRNK